MKTDTLKNPTLEEIALASRQLEDEPLEVLQNLYNNMLREYRRQFGEGSPELLSDSQEVNDFIFDLMHDRDFCRDANLDYVNVDRELPRIMASLSQCYFNQMLRNL